MYPSANRLTSEKIANEEIRRSGPPPHLIKGLFFRWFAAGRYRLKPNEVPLGGPGSDQGSGVEVELAQNMVDVYPHGAVGDHQLPGDIPVRETLRNQRRDLGLARGQ